MLFFQSVKDAKEAAAGGRVITTEITEIEPGKEDVEESSTSTKANKKALGAFESAIAAAEDDADIKVTFNGNPSVLLNVLMHICTKRLQAYIH